MFMQQGLLLVFAVEFYRILNFYRGLVTPMLMGSFATATGAAVFKTGQEASTKGKYPPQPQLATCYVEAGAKLREVRGG